MAKTFDTLLKKTTTPATRTKADKRVRELLSELLLSELRTASGKSQRELAAALGIKQPSLSKLENQTDMRIGTLKRIVEAIGGNLRITAEFAGKVVELRQFDKRATKRRAS